MFFDFAIESSTGFEPVYSGLQTDTYPLGQPDVYPTFAGVISFYATALSCGVKRFITFPVMFKHTYFNSIFSCQNQTPPISRPCSANTSWING